MINTYNESSLHRELKTIFAEKYKGKTEVQVGDSICDILVSKECESLIIEIQTSNLSSLTQKIEILLKTHNVMLVYPLAQKTIIKTIDANGNVISKRTSPKKQNIYSIFEQLYKAHKLFENKNFALCVLPITQTKIKQLTKIPVQTLQKSRRFKKNYLIVDKQLEIFPNLDDSIIFKNKEDVAKLLPKEIPEVFSSKDLKKTQVKTNANKMLWVLSKMGCIKIDHKERNLIFYKKAF